MSRPEHFAPPEIVSKQLLTNPCLLPVNLSAQFYNSDEARKYTSNTRIIEIQGRMTERAIELLCLPSETCCFILDLGCGSGLSGQVLEEEGHCWVGVDISEAMLDVAVERKQDEDISSCDLIQGDLGQGLPFRSGSFDGAISISALQWLCNADKSSHRPVQRLLTLFTSLYSCLTRGSRAVLQFYPENASQMELVTNQAMKAGFTGGVVVDYPNSAKAKKMFLVLFTGGNNTTLPKGLEHESSNTVKYTEERRERLREVRGKAPKKSRDWILEKKARKRRQGREVRPDTKYTGRKRNGKFF